MATRMITTLIDDLDGTDIPRGLGETVRFGIDGRNYEIDLTDENAESLRGALGPFMAASRRVNAAKGRARR